MPLSDSSLATARSAPQDRPPILVWHERASEYVDELRALLPGVNIDGWPTSGRGQTTSPAQILLTWRLSPGALRRLPALRWLQATGAGIDHLLGREDLGQDVLLTRSLGRFGVQVAEYVVGTLLYELIDIEGYRRDQQASRWRPRPRPLIADCTIGVVGLGALGRGIVDRLAALGVTVLGVSRSGDGPDSVAEIFAEPEWRSILPRCDALVLAAPLTAATERMVDSAALAALPEGAVMINVARGALIDTEAVLESLRAGHLGAAVLDVFEREPLDPDDPLWAEPGAIITPHIAAPSEVRPIAEEFAANYHRYVAGEDMANRVERDRGY